MTTFNVTLKAAATLLAALVLSGCADKDLPSLAPVKTVTDTYFGVSVDDPYRYMENMSDTVFLNWMKEYANYTRGVLDEIPNRDALIEQMIAFDERESDRIFGLSIAESGRYFYRKITPEDETGKLYFRDGYEGEENLLFDPDTFSDEEESYVISSVSPNGKGDLVAVNVAPNGSENSTMIFIEVPSGKILDDRLEQIFGGANWSKRGDMVFYGKTNSGDVHDPSRFLNTRNYAHKIGTSQEMDRVIFSSEMYPEIGMDPREIPFVFYNKDDGDFYLALYTVERYQKLYYSEGRKVGKDFKFSWKPVIKKEDEVQSWSVVGDDLYLYTAKNEPGFEIQKTSRNNPDLESAELFVKTPEKGIISGFSIAENTMFYKVKKNGVTERLYRKDLTTGEESEISFDVKPGTIGVRTRGHRFDDVWITLNGWTLDGKRLRYDMEEGSLSEEPLSSMAEYPEFENLVVEEVLVPSHDGVEVPLSLIYNKDLVKDGSAPVVMTGYGSYGISRLPYFNPNGLIWTMYGGIYAISHVRGGGELGDAWRLDGQKTKKPNTWKDFIACAEYLVDNKYTSPEHIAVYGGSAGGILIGRAMTERPDLFAAAMPLVGAMNNVRMEESPNGPVNAPEFGTVQDSVEAMALIEMDSYLALEEGVEYPATLTTAGFNDPRVIVWQPAKFAARLQAVQTGKNPVLFDVDYSSGHGIGDTKSKSFEDLADIFAFGFWQTGHPDFQK